jgi:hypothetical protein
MSHVAVRLLADWFAGPNGIDACAALLPRFPGEPVPPSVTIYDELRTSWVARTRLPQPEHAPDQIHYPAVIVLHQQTQIDADLPQLTPDGSAILEGTVTLVAQLLLRSVDTKQSIAQGMYLLRAMRNSAVLLNDPMNYASRCALGIELRPAQTVQLAQFESPFEDVPTAGALIIPYPVVETVVLP